MKAINELINESQSAWRLLEKWKSEATNQVELLQAKKREC